MISNLLSRNRNGVDLLSSRLYDNDTFYDAFMKDLKHAKSSVYIESPFITLRRMDVLLSIFTRLRQRNIRIVVNTRCPDEHDPEYERQARQAVQAMQELGIKALYTVKHHRKLAIIDDDILWEGSLNILSHNDSCELMRRTESTSLVREMIRFLGMK